MRTYGRLLKNIAAIALLLALLSMLLPFCKFSAGGQEMTLSGLDVVKAGGRAGYTYLTEGRVADTFVLKAPITVGTVKSSLSYVQGVGQMRLLAVCAIAALLPVLLCFLSVGMLFLAEGKKTMLLPTLFTSLVLAELLVVLTVFPALHSFLLAGIYFFTLLHGVAWILILTGWITGGYLPSEKQEKEQKKRGKNPKQSGHRWRRKKFHRRRKTKKKHGRKEDSSTKKKNTAENKILEWNHCQISYDSFEQTYRMVSDSPEKILLLKEDKVIGTLEQGERVRVGRPVTLQIQGKEEHLHLKKMTGKEKLRRTGAIRALILRSLLFFPADMYLRDSYVVIVHRGIFTRSFFVIFRFVGVHFRNRYIVVGQVVIMLFRCLFL